MLGSKQEYVKSASEHQKVTTDENSTDGLKSGQNYSMVRILGAEKYYLPKRPKYSQTVPR